jgi:hypothetical protein
MQWVYGWGMADQWTNTVIHMNEARAQGIESIVLGIDFVYSNIATAKVAVTNDSPRSIITKQLNADVASRTPMLKATTDPEAQLRAYFTMLQGNNLLSMVKVLYPKDEPDLAGLSDAQIQSTNAMIRRVAADYPELKGVKLAVIYNCKSDFVGATYYDILGCDDYNSGAGVLTNGTINKLAAANPNAELMLVPGGADTVGRQDPTPWFNYAQSDNRIKYFVPFIWFDYWNNGGKAPGALGIKSNGMAPSYCVVGKKIKLHDPNVVCT